jgi:hypothetical protein
MTALWNWQTCLPVRKRRHVAALQIGALPKYESYDTQMLFGWKTGYSPAMLARPR